MTVEKIWKEGVGGGDGEWDRLGIFYILRFKWPKASKSWSDVSALGLSTLQASCCDWSHIHIISMSYFEIAHTGFVVIKSKIYRAHTLT